jgi:hypothetical protein
MNEDNKKSKPANFDLDAALEEIASKLRPAANGVCGTSVLVSTSNPSSAHHASPCYCFCCSAPKT